MSNTVRAETTIDGFKVTIDDDNCWVEKGRFCSSLALVESIGHIEDTNADGHVDINESTVDKILAWADANGF